MQLRGGEQVTYNTATKQLSKSKVSRKDKWWKRGGFRMFIRNFFNKILHPRDSGRAEVNNR